MECSTREHATRIEMQMTREMYLSHHPHNVPYQACLQHQGTHATELMPPLVHPSDALVQYAVQNAVANCQTAQEEAKSVFSTSQKKAGRRATASTFAGGAAHVCLLIIFCIVMHAYFHNHTYAHKTTHTHTYIHTCVNLCMYTNTKNTFICTHMYAHAHAQTHTFVRVSFHPHIYTVLFLYICNTFCTYVYMYTCIYVCGSECIYIFMDCSTREHTARNSKLQKKLPAISASQRTLSGLLAASGYACSSAATTSSPTLFAPAWCSGGLSSCAIQGKERRKLATPA